MYELNLKGLSMKRMSDVIQGAHRDSDFVVISMVAEHEQTPNGHQTWTVTVYSATPGGVAKAMMVAAGGAPEFVTEREATAWIIRQSNTRTA